MSFYRWAEDQHLIPALPWLEEVRLAAQRSADFMRHTRASQQYTNSDDIKLRAFVEPPKLLSLEQCKKLLRAPMSGTIRLMTALMLQAGLRNAECRTFPKCYVFDPRRLNPRDRIRLELSPEHMKLKLEKPRTVFISWQMMMQLFEYSRFGDRAIRSGQQADRPGPEQAACSPRRPSPQLILNRLAGIDIPGVDVRVTHKSVT